MVIFLVLALGLVSFIWVYIIDGKYAKLVNEIHLKNHISNNRIAELEIRLEQLEEENESLKALLTQLELDINK